MKFVVAFSSPKRSAVTVNAAARHAKALGAEVILLRVIPDPQKVGVVAQLISTSRPQEKAQKQVEAVVALLQAQGIQASGIVKEGEVAKTIAETAQSLAADLLFVGTQAPGKGPMFFQKRDPIVSYLIEHAQVSVCLIRLPDAPMLDDTDDLKTGNFELPTAEQFTNPSSGASQEIPSSEQAQE